MNGKTLGNQYYQLFDLPNKIYGAILIYELVLMRIFLIFESPDKYYVSRKKKILPIEIRWANGSVQNTEIVIYPTLWRDGDTYSQTVEQAGEGLPEIILGGS